MFIYGIKDRLAKGYLQIFVGKEPEQIRRELEDVVNSPAQGNVMATHPDDFDLYKLGEIDQMTGKITNDEELLLNYAELKHNVKK